MRIASRIGPTHRFSPKAAILTMLMAVVASAADPSPANAGEGFARYLEQQAKARLQARRADARKAADRAARARAMALRRAAVAGSTRLPSN